MKVYRFASVLLPKSEGQIYISFPTSQQIKKILIDEKIDVLHIIIPMPSAIASMKAAQSLGIKTIVHSHTQPENLFLHLPTFLPLATLNKLFYRYLNWIYRKANAVVYPSEFSKKLFPLLNKTHKIAVISNGVDTSIYRRVNAEAFFEKFNLSHKKKNILFLGRLHPEKRVDTLIRAIPYILKERQDIHIIIAGFGHLDKTLEQLARDLNVDEHITFCGKVIDEESILAYNACDLFVLPSLAELEGMAVLEAMACGKPILVADSENSASTYFVGENGLLFTPGDHKDLAAQVLRILRDPLTLRAMGEASYEKSKQYDINESVSRLEELYYSLIGQ